MCYVLWSVDIENYGAFKIGCYNNDLAELKKIASAMNAINLCELDMIRVVLVCCHSKCDTIYLMQRWLSFMPLTFERSDK